MEGRKKKRDLPVPFYVQQDHTEAIHERVVGETRAAVRALQTSRPFTPLDRTRGLFGASGSANPADSRPTSAVT